MKDLFVNQLSDGTSFENQVFALQEFSQHKDKNGNAYLRIVLQDKTGDIVGKVWNDKIPFCKINKESIGEVLEVTASISSYRNKLQATVAACEVTEKYNLEDLIQVSDKGLESMWKRIQKHIDSIQDKDLRKLFDNLFGDAELLQKFKEAPAAERVHHDFVGGLMEHILEMLDLSGMVVKLYPEANLDIVKAGCIIHDIGKTIEIIRTGTTFGWSTEGKIVGHMGLGVQIVKDHLPEDFPENLWYLLFHIILSHHGTLEFGSPIVPKTIDAMIVHKLDQLSSQVRIFSKVMDMAEEGREFSDYNRYIGGEVYLKPYISGSDSAVEGKVEVHGLEDDTHMAGAETVASVDPDQVGLF